MPADVDPAAVEQRIIEQAARLPASGGVTGWAALRWRGAAFFDGRAPGGRIDLPVPLVLGGVGNIRPDPRCIVSREQFAPSEQRWVDGLPCASVQRSLFDEMRRGHSLWHAVISLDMAAAAGLISVRLMAEYVGHRPAWTGVPLVRKALLLAIEDSRSPQETRMRLAWVIDAGLPHPVCNQPVFGRDGQLLGYPDLLDPVAGLVGEYDGADHLDPDRRRADAFREERFRQHGLEYFEVVRGDLDDRERVVRRMLGARHRARFLPPDRRGWTLDPPAWFRAGETLDDRLVRCGVAASLTHP